METMKNKLKLNDSGMTIVQFIFVILLVFVVLAVFLEVGYYLKNEATVVACSKVLASKVTSTGEILEVDAKNAADGLNAEGIRNIKIRVYDMSNPNQPVISFVRNQADGDIVEDSFNNTVGGDGTLGFRHNFKLVIWGEHPLREVNTIGVSTIGAKVGFSVDGKVERFKPE